MNNAGLAMAFAVCSVMAACTAKDPLKAPPGPSAGTGLNAASAATGAMSNATVEQLKQASQLGAFNALFAQATIRQKAADHAMAIDLFKAAIAALPDTNTTAPAWNDLGWSLYSLNRDEEAVAAFKKALELRPSFQIAKNNLQMTLQRLANVKTVTGSTGAKASSGKK
ncbi:MAG: tetratricopeptide repeat protein [Deltaproteobacteria bacterium]|nr:tetratricopeptide repeat protein [Deltaproteobacteria bacterium]